MENKEGAVNDIKEERLLGSAAIENHETEGRRMVEKDEGIAASPTAESSDGSSQPKKKRTKGFECRYCGKVFRGREAVQCLSLIHI